MTYLRCPHCERVVAASGKSHIAACSPEAREARRQRTLFFAARYRARTRPQREQVFRGWHVPEKYLTRPADLDACPSCDGPKTKKAALCVACRLVAGKRKRPLADRFWSKVDPTGHCWLWMGALNEHGYGVIHGPERLAPRTAWELTFGSIPDGLDVLHRCDNPPCVRPSHLWLGTQRDNTADMIAKGRAAWQKAAR